MYFDRHTFILVQKYKKNEKNDKMLKKHLSMYKITNFECTFVSSTLKVYEKKCTQNCDICTYKNVF